MTELKGKKTIKEYREGFLLSLLILIVGTLLEWFNKGNGVALPSWPINILLGLSFIVLLIFLHLYFRTTNIIRTLSRVPAALSSIILFSILVLILGMTKQNEPNPPILFKISGFNHIRNSFTFLLSGLYLMTTLGLVTLRRITPLNFKNIGFTMNHVGLWLIIFAGSMGAGDLSRLEVSINENQTVWYAFNQKSQPQVLPFTLKLIDFKIKEFPPKIAMVDRNEMTLAKDVQNNLPMINEGFEMKTGDWNFKVLKYLPEATRDSIGFSISNEPITSEAALIQINNDRKGISRKEWISCGNYSTPPTYITLDETYLLAMTRPEVKEYSSQVEIVTKDGKSDTTEILVNKPLGIGGWKLYQLSYDENLGKYSKLSVIEAIKDPWIPIIYIGVFMVILGALYIFWIGRNPKIE